MEPLKRNMVKRSKAYFWAIACFLIPAILATLVVLLTHNDWEEKLIAKEKETRKFEVSLLKQQQELAEIEAMIKVKTAEAEAEYAKERASLTYSIVKYIMKRNSKTPVETAEIIAQRVIDLCIANNIHIDLIVGLIETESIFNPSAVSHKNARGLMQVRGEVWSEELGIVNLNDLFGINYNIASGIKILKHYIEQEGGNITKALMAYNGTSEYDFPRTVYTNVGRFTVFREHQ